ncbi:hypothetical protein BY458DRAFT_530623 [Sporodiniella umbellata]|nr:hypothetical protein BY458DRAFT_530623 [Sporodiniella umbellata]
MAHHEKNRDKTELPSPERVHGDKVADEMTRDAKAMGVAEDNKHHSLGSEAGATAAAGAAAVGGTGAAAKHHQDKSTDLNEGSAVDGTSGGKSGYVKDHHGKEEVVPGLGAGALGTGAVESVVKNDDGINEETGRAMEEEEKKEAIEHKPSATEKIKGNLEKVVGKLTNNPEKVAKGEDLAHGRAL